LWERGRGKRERKWPEWGTQTVPRISITRKTERKGLRKTIWRIQGGQLKETMGKPDRDIRPCIRGWGKREDVQE